MPKVYYRALMEPAADGGFGVIFPEVPGCTSGGDNAEDAVRNAAEGLSGHLELLLEDGDPIPEPAPLDAPLPAWLDEALEEGEVRAERLIRVLVPAELPGRSVRANVTIEEGLLTRIDAAAAARGMSRSAFLAAAARRMLAEPDGATGARR